MNIIAYKVKGDEHNYYDFSTIKEILRQQVGLNINRSKLQRDLRRIAKADFIKYKNQHLYKQEVLYKLVADQCIQDLDKKGAPLYEH